MKQYRLSTREKNQNLRDDPGKLAERIAEEQYSGWNSSLAENFDLAKRSGAVAEVKSTATTIGDQYRESGRFRLFKNQHDRLVRADRNGSARYIFVLFDVSSRDVSASLVQRKPSSIGSIIGGRGGWNKSGHSSGPQKKLPIEAVFD